VREDFAILLFFFGVSMTANVAFAIATFRAARRAQRLENRLLGARGPAEDDRVERLEQTVESVDAKVGQLARGQEFLSKLLSERRRIPGAREHGVTPH
jgi:hypothetical protein